MEFEKTQVVLVYAFSREIRIFPFHFMICTRVLYTTHCLPSIRRNLMIMSISIIQRFSLGMQYWCFLLTLHHIQKYSRNGIRKKGIQKRYLDFSLDNDTLFLKYGFYKIIHFLNEPTVLVICTHHSARHRYPRGISGTGTEIGIPYIAQEQK